MTEQEFISDVLWPTGQFWAPNCPEANNVAEADLPLLRFSDRSVIEAVQNYQRSDANLPPLVRLFHARALNADGIVGPATLALATLGRCPLPDHPPPPNATFRYSDPDIQRAVESMQERATGSGSWPHGCYGTNGVHEVKISYDPSNASIKQKEWLPEVKRRSHAAVAAMGVRLIEVPVGQGNIAVSFRSLGGSTIGLAEFNNGTCGGRVFCYLNPNYSPDVDQVLVLLMHENGHNFNLDHRPNAIMNPSILRVKPAWVEWNGSQIVYQDNSYPTLKKYFGGLPLDPPEPPGPPVGAGYVRFKINFKAGTHVGMELGADTPAGDYMLLPTDETPPPVNPD